MTLKHGGITGMSATDFANMKQGWGESFDKLAEYLESEQVKVTKTRSVKMLSLSGIMIGSTQPKVLAEFYKKVFGKPADMTEDSWYGWQAGNSWVMIGEHSEVKGKAKEPQRLMLNFETKDVKKEFTRIKKSGAKVIKEPYEMEGSLIATFADPDGNYFQIMTPWEMGK
jgi:predicted enzyme related to lactoylglutathione lyase